MLSSETKVLWKIWGAAFLYVCAVNIFIQFILLPFLLPQLHAGGGLFVGSFDSLSFLHAATDMAGKIKATGWGAWELRPRGQAPAGIAAAIFVVTWSKLWVLIPLNAALHASAFLVLFRIVSTFVLDRVKVLWCVLPFLVFPSNLQWTSQWHKDGFSILGFLLFLQGIISMLKTQDQRDKQLANDLFTLISCLCGIFLIWVVRPFMLMIMKLFAEVFFCFLLLIFLKRALEKKISGLRIVSVFLCALLIFFGLSQKTNLCVADFNENILSLDRQAVGEDSFETPLSDEEIVPLEWRKSPGFPLSIENKAFSLSQIRKGFQLCAAHSDSNVDADVGFKSIKDILMYIPRAIQIVLFAPFPDQWFSEGSSSGSALMRKIAAFEMIAIYFALIFLPYSIWYWRKRIEIWFILSFCLYMMIIYGLVYCNVGSLYRMRYVYIMTFVALGIAGFILFLGKLKSRKILKK